MRTWLCLSDDQCETGAACTFPVSGTLVVPGVGTIEVPSGTFICDADLSTLIPLSYGELCGASNTICVNGLICSDVTPPSCIVPLGGLCFEDSDCNNPILDQDPDQDPDPGPNICEFVGGSKICVAL